MAKLSKTHPTNFKHGHEFICLQKWCPAHENSCTVSPAALRGAFIKAAKITVTLKTSNFKEKAWVWIYETCRGRVRTVILLKYLNKCNCAFFKHFCKSLYIYFPLPRLYNSFFLPVASLLALRGNSWLIKAWYRPAQPVVIWRHANKADLIWFKVQCSTM